MKNICTKIIDILKKLAKVVLVFVAVIALTVAYYILMELLFDDILSPTARAVLSNFIVFVAIIAFVLRQAVHPKAMLEQMQTAVENEIKTSETTKEESEKRLTEIQKSSNNVRKEIDDIIEKSKENAQLVGAKILKEADETALCVKDNAEKIIENNMVLLKNDLIRRASLASVEIAKKQIIKELSNNETLHEKLIDESIEAMILNKEEEVGEG